MRVFDALNDIENMKFTIEVVKKYKGLADCALSYTVDPKITQKDRLYALLKGKKLPGKIFTVDYFMNKAKELEALGADMITVKDMAGLIDPWTASALYSRMKTELSIPVDHHSHCTPGYGIASAVVAMLKVC
jgi:pyruvate/oxaloacetate carboxyltransferase